MKETLPVAMEFGRQIDGPFGSPRGAVWGAFIVAGPLGERLKIISSGIDKSYGWEHVSVSCEHRTPTWAEMSWVKDVFWREDEAVMQLHPPKKNYVNCHPYCLHMWRPLNGKIPLPWHGLVGPRNTTWEPHHG